MFHPLSENTAKHLKEIIKDNNRHENSPKDCPICNKLLNLHSLVKVPCMLKH